MLYFMSYIAIHFFINSCVVYIYFQCIHVILSILTANVAVVITEPYAKINFV